MQRTVAQLFVLPLVFTSPALAQTKLPTWTLTAELRIDGAAENLSSVNWVGVSPRGIIAIVQPQDRLVLFYSPQGKRIGSFGRAGEGPGEFRGMGQLGWVGDTLWIRDYMLRRATYISPQYKHVRDVSDPPTVGPGVAESEPCSSRRGRGNISNPFCAHTVRSSAPDSSRIAIVTQSNPTSSIGNYTVTVIRQSGDTMFSRSFATPGVPIPKQYADSIVELITRQLGPDARSFYQSTMPAYFQPVRGPIVGADGTIWLMLWAAPGAATIDYVVLGPNGAPLATVTLPRNVVPQVVSRTKVWAVVTDAAGLDSIVRFRVQ